MTDFAAFPRNKMVEYLTDWVMGTSNQAADDDIKCLTRYRLCSFVPFIICVVASSLKTFLMLCFCERVMQGSGPGEYGGSSVSVGWSSPAA